MRIACAFSPTCAAPCSRTARVLVLEAPLPSDDSPGPGRWLDLQVMVLCGGRERTVEEYARLFEQGRPSPVAHDPHHASGDDRGRSGRADDAACLMAQRPARRRRL